MMVVSLMSCWFMGSCVGLFYDVQNMCGMEGV
jgi:hypothetical protein